MTDVMNRVGQKRIELATSFAKQLQLIFSFTDTTNCRHVSLSRLLCVAQLPCAETTIHIVLRLKRHAAIIVYDVWVNVIRVTHTNRCFSFHGG